MTELSDLELQRRRAAKNQSLFREVNERIEDLAASATFSTFICECMDETCDASVSMTVEEYEHVRSHSNSFVVLPGHEVPGVEATTESNHRYLIVTKLGAGQAVAEALDPRKRSTGNG
ncbi:MAG: hypothetical protein ACJ757_08605 [Gaiellaceae bacterium]